MLIASISSVVAAGSVSHCAEAAGPRLVVGDKSVESANAAADCREIQPIH